jgi:hypothetical protein
MAGCVIDEDDVRIGIDLIFARRYPEGICWCLARHLLHGRFN